MSYSDETSDFFKNLLLSLGFIKQPTMILDTSTHYRCPKTRMSIYLNEDVKILPSGYIKQQIGRMINDHGFKYEDIFRDMERIKRKKK